MSCGLEPALQALPSWETKDPLLSDLSSPPGLCRRAAFTDAFLKASLERACFLKHEKPVGRKITDQCIPPPKS